MKYYLKSGSVQRIVMADSPEQATIQVFTDMLSKLDLPDLPTPDMSENEIVKRMADGQVKVIRELLTLWGVYVLISERGFEDEEAQFARTESILSRLMRRAI